MGVEQVEELVLEWERYPLKAEGLGADRLRQLVEVDPAEQLALVVLVENPVEGLVERPVEEVEEEEEAVELAGLSPDLEGALEMEVELEVQGLLGG